MSGFTDKVLEKVKKTLKGSVKKEDNAVRWGILGLGYMAECFSTAIDGNRKGVVAAVASRSEEKAMSFAAKHGSCRAYGSYQSMLYDPSLDIVYIATPMKFHYDNIKICLQAGKNVLCEKPITSNVEELKELQQLAKAKDCFLMEGMWMKCLPTYQKAVAWINEGRIGTIDLIKADFYKREEIDISRAIFDKGGGVLRDYGVYAIAFPTGFVKGMPDELRGASRLSCYGIDSDWSIYMCYKSIQVFLNISSDYQGVSKAAVMGDKGTIEWNAQFNRANVITLYDAQGKQIEQFTVSYKFEGFEYEVEEAQNAIRSNFKESRLVPLESSVVTQEIISQLMKNKGTEI